MFVWMFDSPPSNGIFQNPELLRYSTYFWIILSYKHDLFRIIHPKTYGRPSGIIVNV